MSLRLTAAERRARHRRYLARLAVMRRMASAIVPDEYDDSRDGCV